ncbi:1-phosphofructokinase family hexose kinase [Paracoccus xiamenensis]|uniref:1-phosphofructokinase family hexose kinase n=1 Tax=Paracoccus xiamenensis TaxID=2714901 RepID=UPI0014095A0D|nr:1-phosphofructokinase family hexose kinase [Paracoccus xiamenensis]NHF73338.1 1-phosphofructokinase family hexose kinase [Paracoccus xiamenensis]
MTQAPILTVTLNPALDISTGAEKVVPDVKLRCDAPVVDPGGGGINVSRAIRIVGGQSTAFVALGGTTGRRLAELLEAAGLDWREMRAPGETRQSLAVMDRDAALQYRFVMPGPEWQSGDVGKSIAHIIQAAQPGGLVVLSGSNPPGVPDDYAALLAAKLADGDAGLVVDTSGKALRAVADGGHNFALLRMDREEAEGLAGQPLPERADTARFAASLVEAGAAQAVIVARGGDGNIIATPKGAWHAEAAKVDIVSKVGAGDSFVAGFTLGLARGLPPDQALGLGAAMASATCMTPATELCRAEDVERLFAARVVTAL